MDQAIDTLTFLVTSCERDVPLHNKEVASRTDNAVKFLGTFIRLLIWSRYMKFKLRCSKDEGVHE